jgi:phosphoserine aminotransferase
MRVFNFNPGPAALPEEILLEAREELLDYQGSGMSVLEMSHRSAPYERLHNEAQSLLKELLGLGDGYQALFLQGGATLQFAMAPLNLLSEGKTADYAVTGEFARRAWQDARRLGKTRAAADLSAENFRRVPAVSELTFSPQQAYLHITTNNTIYGTAWREYPDFGAPILIADMSSDFLSKPFDAGQFSLIYAGIQKNLGPAGATVVIIKRELLDACRPDLPEYLSYKAHAKSNSLLNTPAVFAVYLMHKALLRLKAQGGLAATGEQTRAKSALIYALLDKYPDFYRGHAEKASRSFLNATFRLPSPELEDVFIRQAEQRGLVGIKGHRSVGGLRVSMYNGLPRQACERLADFMEDFYRRGGGA